MPTSPQSPDVAARLLRARLGAACFAEGAVRAFAATSAAAGVVALAARILFPSLATAPLALAAAGAVAAASAAAGLLAMRRRPATASCLAAIDAASDANGLFLSRAGEAGYPVPSPALSKVSLHLRHLPAAAALAAVFCAVVLALPASLFAHASRPRPTIDLGETVQAQAQTAEKLAEADLLPAETALAISNELARIRQDSDASDPARDLAALDHIEEQLDRAAGESAFRAEEEMDALQAASALISALQKTFPQPSGDAPPPPSQEALSSFLSSLPLDKSTSSALQEALEQMASSTNSPSSSPAALSPEQLAALQSMLQSAIAERAAKLGALRELGKLDPSKFSKCNGGSCTNGAACAAALSKLLSECSGASAEAAACLSACEVPGAGGPSRGRADAPITFGDPSSEEGAEYDNGALAAQVGEGPVYSAGKVTADPTADSAASPTAPGGLAAPATPSAGVSADAPLLPRHKAAVSRYFDGE